MATTKRGSPTLDTHTCKGPGRGDGGFYHLPAIPSVSVIIPCPSADISGGKALVASPFPSRPEINQGAGGREVWTVRAR